MHLTRLVPVFAMVAIPVIGATGGIGSGSSSDRHGNPASPDSYLRADRLAPALDALRQTLGPRAEVFDLAAYPNVVAVKTVDGSGLPRLYTVDAGGHVQSSGLGHATLAQKPSAMFRLAALRSSTPQALIEHAGKGFRSVSDVQATQGADGQIAWNVDFNGGGDPYEADIHGRPTGMTALESGRPPTAASIVANQRPALAKAERATAHLDGIAACVKAAGSDVARLTACTANP